MREEFSTFDVYSDVQKNRGNASDIEYISHARMIGKVFYACHIGRQRARLYDSDNVRARQIWCKTCSIIHNVLDNS